VDEAHVERDSTIACCRTNYSMELSADIHKLTDSAIEMDEKQSPAKKD
jgi:hypothetical protein